MALVFTYGTTTDQPSKSTQPRTLFCLLSDKCSIVEHQLYQLLLPAVLSMRVLRAVFQSLPAVLLLPALLFLFLLLLLLFLLLLLLLHLCCSCCYCCIPEDGRQRSPPGPAPASATAPPPPGPGTLPLQARLYTGGLPGGAGDKNIVR